MAQTTFHATMAMANALSHASGDDTRVDVDDVRAYLQVKGLSETIRRQFLTPSQEHFIQQALDFLLDETMPKM